jgi:AmmeMemoRadiSam system protein A
MVPDAPLGKTVGAMALQAAFSDPRFPPVTPEELPKLTVEISALTPMKPVSGAGDIVVGRDGVLLAKGGRSAVFLPQVATEQGWGRDEMLDHLCRKAGLPTGCWKEGASFSVYQAEVFGEGM